jgi:hypothetical protein
MIVLIVVDRFTTYRNSRRKQSSFTSIMAPSLTVSYAITYYYHYAFFSMKVFKLQLRTGQLFMVCIGLVSAGSIFSLMNALLSRSNRPVPIGIQRFAARLAPLLFLRCSGRLKLCHRGRRRRRSHRLNSSPRNEVALQGIPAPPADDPEIAPASNVPQTGEGQSTARTAQQPGYARYTEPTAVEWSTISDLTDRCFFALHTLACIATFIGYVAYGYIPWSTYGGINLNATEWKYLCTQLRFQHSEDAESVPACRDALEYFDRKYN